MVVTRFASQLFFAGSVLFGLSPAYAEELELDSALVPLRELTATTDVQEQIRRDRLDPAFSDITESYEGSMEFAVEKTFPSENWNISLVSAKRTDGTFMKLMILKSKPDDKSNEETAPTFCQEVNSLLVSTLGEPNMTLDMTQPLPDETNFIRFSNLRSTWHHKGLGLHSECTALHSFIPEGEGGQIFTYPAFATITLTDIENMQTLKALSLVTCNYQGTVTSRELSTSVEKDLTVDFYLNETDGQLLGLDKRTLATDVLFTDNEIVGVWEDLQFSREFRINRYSGVSTLSIESVSEASDTTYTSRSGECIAQTERKF